MNQLLSAEAIANMQAGLKGRIDGLRGQQKFVGDPDWTTERAQALLDERYVLIAALRQIAGLYKDHGAGDAAENALRCVGLK